MLKKNVLFFVLMVSVFQIVNPAPREMNSSLSPKRMLINKWKKDTESKNTESKNTESKNNSIVGVEKKNSKKPQLPITCNFRYEHKPLKNVHLKINSSIFKDKDYNFLFKKSSLEPNKVYLVNKCGRLIEEKPEITDKKKN